MCDTCGDNRFELIEKYKQKLLDATNIEDSPEEMAVIDNILFRFWQMGWLKGELFGNSEQLDDTISRQAAIEAMSELQGRAASKGELTGISKAWKRIKALPTVDAVPVRHGKWVDENGNRPYGYRFNWLCSECGRPQHTSTAKLLKEFEEEHRWCHFCGARMDGKDGEQHV